MQDRLRDGLAFVPVRWAPGFIEKADEPYRAGVDLHALALLNLSMAEGAPKAGDLELSRKYLDRAVRFRVLGNDSMNAAYQVFPSAVEGDESREVKTA